jgi:hypothetical protein
LANITQQGVVDVNNLYSNLLAQPLVGGAVSNAGTNIIVGDIGTNAGAITGFESVTLSGVIYPPNQGSSNVQVSIYVDGVIVPTSTREHTNVITKEDIAIADVVTLAVGQVVTAKVLNSIGISRFYNRILTMNLIN